jgi:hypothetical protein
MSDDLHSFAQTVTDEAGFIRFLAALAADRADECTKEAANPSSPYGPGANGWENGTIDSFLEAASAWAEASIDGLPHYEKPINPWTRCAAILLMGKHYE